VVKILQGSVVTQTVLRG